MTWPSEHIKWLVDTGERLSTTDGKIIEIWEFRHENDEKVLSEWARYFRNHYCNDCEIDVLREGTGLDPRKFLSKRVFPDATKAPGPSTRSGDFAEILVADFLEYIERYWVPRFRYDDKNSRNESSKGVDVIAIKFFCETESPKDTLALYEVKAKFSAGTSCNRLQEAVKDSAKDYNVRKAESLNALKRRFLRKDKLKDAKKVERFQNKADRPYVEISGAAALFSINTYSSSTISSTETSTHPNADQLKLIVIKGADMMNLVHDLYRRAADEA